MLGCPLLDDHRRTAEHQSMESETKALKQISFPEMDSDGLPSSFVTKVLACLSKWSIKMNDLTTSLDKSNAAMNP